MNINGYPKELILISKIESINDLELLLEKNNQLCQKQFEILREEADKAKANNLLKHYDYLTDELFLYYEILPRINNNSILMNAYALLEHTAYEYAKGAKFEWNLTPQINGQYLKNYIDYINENLKIKILTVEMEEQIKSFRLIRNRLLHSNGFIDRKNNQHTSVIKVIESNPLVSISDEDKIIVSIGYVKQCLDLLREVIQEMHDAVYHDYR